MLGAQNRFEAPFRLGLVPADIGDQRRVIVAEHGEAFAVQFVESRQRAARVLGARICPGGQQDALDVGLTVGDVPAEGGARVRILMRLHLLNAARQIGDRVLAVVRENVSGEAVGLRHIAVGERRDQRPFGEVAIARIVAQSLAEKRRGGEGVALRIGDDRREKIAGEAGADLERPRHGEAILRMGRDGSLGEEAARKRQREGAAKRPGG